MKEKYTFRDCRRGKRFLVWKLFLEIMTCKAQGAQLSALWWIRWMGWEVAGISKGEKIYIYKKMVYFRFSPWVGKISRSRKWQPAPVFLPGKVHVQRNLEGYSPWDWIVRYDWAHTHKQQKLMQHCKSIIVQ